MWCLVELSLIFKIFDWTAKKYPNSSQESKDLWDERWKEAYPKQMRRAFNAICKDLGWKIKERYSVEEWIEMSRMG